MRLIAKRERRCSSHVWGVALATVLGIGVCWGDSVEPLSPKPDQIFGWGRQAPTVRLEARAVSSQPADRVFITAMIADAQGKTIDRVPLYDDGTHGDAQAGDLVFTEFYTPRAEGIFQVRFKAEWERNGKRHTRFSEVRPFEIVRAPYVRLEKKLAEERRSVGSTANVQAVLLIGNDEHYKGALEAITLRATCAPSGVAELPQKLTTQPTVRYRFEKPGEHQLTVQAVMTYKGQPIATEPDTLTVVYNTPPQWLLWMGGIAVLLGLFVLPGKRVPVYEHYFQLQNSTYGTSNSRTLTAEDPQLALENGTIMLEYVKGSPQVKLARGTLTASGEEKLEVGALLNAGEQYRTPSGNILKFCEATPMGTQAVTPRIVPNTLWKIIALIVGSAFIVYYLILQNQLAQLTHL